MSIYDYEITCQDGSKKSINEFAGKTILIINSATGCGFTPQYAELEKLYEEFKDRNFIILDFPCNQFGGQAPGSDEEILDFCNSRYGVQFLIFHKINVNGENAEPLFVYLKNEKKYNLKSIKMKMISLISKTAKDEADIVWNFTKFLVSKNGEVIRRFEPVEDLSLVKEEILKIL